VSLIPGSGGVADGSSFEPQGELVGVVRVGVLHTGGSGYERDEGLDIREQIAIKSMCIAKHELPKGRWRLTANTGARNSCKY
jgi:hypothetical protein